MTPQAQQQRQTVSPHPYGALRKAGMIVPATVAPRPRRTRAAWPLSCPNRSSGTPAGDQVPEFLSTALDPACGRLR